MMKWLQQLLYKLSGHKEARKPLDVPTALQAMLEHGITIGKHDATPVIVEKRVCRRHEMVLLIEIEIGHYICPVCREEKHTGPMRLHSGQLAREWARSHTRPSTQQMDSIYWRNHQGETR